MARIQNSFQAQTPIGAAITNLGNAFFGSMTSPAEAAKLQAEADYKAALTEQARVAADQGRAKLSAAASIPGLFESAITGPIPRVEMPLAAGAMGPGAPMQVSRDEHIVGMLPELAGAMFNSGDVSQIGALFNTVMANTPGTADESVIRSLVGSGKPIGVNEAVSLGHQDQIRADNSRNTIANTVAGVSATPLSLGQVQGQKLAALWDTLNESERQVVIGVQDKPDMVPYQTPGGTVLLNSSDPYAVAGAVPAPIPGSGGTVLGAVDLTNKVGTAAEGDTDITTATLTAAAEAAKLGISPEEYQVLKQVQAAQSAAGIMSGAVIPPELMEAHRLILEKVARNQAARAGVGGTDPNYQTAPVVPQGYQVIE